MPSMLRLGAHLIPVEPPQFPVGSGLILQPEAGAAFENLVLSGKVKEMVQQSPNSWPNTFRSAQFIPAVDYINANRARVLLMQQWWELFKNFDFTERIRLEFRAESFNTFNHTQFQGDIQQGGISTALGASDFGQITKAFDPRELQLGLKFLF